MGTIRWIWQNWEALGAVLAGIGVVGTAAWKLIVWALKVWADLQDAKKDGLTLREIIKVVEASNFSSAKANFKTIEEQLSPEHKDNLAARVRELTGKESK